MNQIFNKATTACLTGHRPKSLPWKYNENSKSCKRFKKDLKNIFKNLIQEGITIFLSGMAEGFDMIGAEILINLRKRNKHIKIVAVVPCCNQEIKWAKSQQIRYHRVLKKCDEIIILSNKYTTTCMIERNRFMVENSNTVIAGYIGENGGTRYTIQYAQEKGLQIFIIDLNLYKK